MGSSASITKQAAKFVGEMHALLNVILQSPDTSLVHDYRVGMKRLRALHRMLAAIDPSMPPNLSAPWKKIYRRAGELRDLQLLQQFIREQPAMAVVQRILEDQLSWQERLLRQEIMTRDLPVMAVQHWDPGSGEPVWDHYFETVIRSWLAYYRQPHYEDILHQLRKILKDIFYNLQWLNKAKVQPSAWLLPLVAFELKPVTDSLGDLQDRVVRIRQFKQLAILPELAEASGLLDQLAGELMGGKAVMEQQLFPRLKAVAACFEQMVVDIQPAHHT